MNPDMKKLAKDNEYLFIQDGTRDHTAKLILEMLKDKKKKKKRVQEQHQLLPNSPEMGSAGLRSWGCGRKMYTEVKG